ncbi:hypothetical protein FB545_4291 [Peribacillus frigoritolerans]|nr:hypothetical protein FB545_4291 [Peribacillus frigoritolerans]
MMSVRLCISLVNGKSHSSGNGFKIKKLVNFHFILPTVQLFVDECNKGMIFL